MSNYEHDYDHESSLAINVSDSSWETYDPFICLGINETMLYTQADIETYNALSAFVQQQDVIMGNDGFEAEAGPESSRAPSGTELCRSGCDYGIRYSSPHDRSQIELTIEQPSRCLSSLIFEYSARPRGD